MHNMYEHIYMYSKWILIQKEHVHQIFSFFVGKCMICFKKFIHSIKLNNKVLNYIYFYWFDLRAIVAFDLLIYFHYFHHCTKHCLGTVSTYVSTKLSIKHEHRHTIIAQIKNDYIFVNSPHNFNISPMILFNN